jgi:acetyltransferase-like isoleucine patch superfamily enzyme
MNASEAPFLSVASRRRCADAEIRLAFLRLRRQRWLSRGGDEMKKPLVTRIRSGLTPWAREAYRQYLRVVFGMDIGRGAKISLSAHLDKTNPRGVHIGEYTSVAFDAAILTHDFVNRKHVDVHIGKNCLIGARSIIYPGVSVGDHCIVSTAAVVMKDVPPNCIVAGNPGRVVETGVQTGPLGIRVYPAAVAAAPPSLGK